MKALLVLLVGFAAALMVSGIGSGEWRVVFCGNLAMCLMLCFTAIGHFKYAKGMEMMMPAAVPFKKQWVFWTGIFEPLAGGCLLVPAWRPFTGVVLILFFLLILPANISAALRRVDFEKGGFGGKGIGYLWFRVPLQVFLIVWVYWFSVRS